MVQQNTRLCLCTIVYTMLKDITYIPTHIHTYIHTVHTFIHERLMRAVSTVFSGKYTKQQ